MIVFQESAREVRRRRKASVERSLRDILVFVPHEVDSLVKTHQVNEIHGRIICDILELSIKFRLRASKIPGYIVNGEGLQNIAFHIFTEAVEQVDRFSRERGCVAASEPVTIDLGIDLGALLKQLLHAYLEGRDIEGLLHEGIRTALIAACLLLLKRAGGQQYYRDMARHIVLLKRRADFESIKPRHHDVAEDDIGYNTQCLCKSHITVFGQEHLIIGREYILDIKAHIHIILNDEHNLPTVPAEHHLIRDAGIQILLPHGREFEFGERRHIGLVVQAGIGT